MLMGRILALLSQLRADPQHEFLVFLYSDITFLSKLIAMMFGLELKIS